MLRKFQLNYRYQCEKDNSDSDGDISSFCSNCMKRGIFQESKTALDANLLNTVVKGAKWLTVLSIKDCSNMISPTSTGLLIHFSLETLKG